MAATDVHTVFCNRSQVQGSTFGVKNKEGIKDPKFLLKIYSLRPLRLPRSSGRWYGACPVALEDGTGVSAVKKKLRSAIPYSVIRRY